MGERRKGRELALQALYLMDIAHLPKDKALKTITGAEKGSPKTRKFAELLTLGTADHMDEINGLIVKYAANWEMNRMAALDRNLLRLGAFEILYELDTPVSVIIDEAVEIAKTFSTPDSGGFVNGILDKIKLDRPKA